MLTGKKNTRVSFALFGALLIAIATVPVPSQTQPASATRERVVGKQGGTNSEQVIESEAGSTLPAVKIPPNPAFALATLRNTALETNLDWHFGGKAQRGWRLYVPLIRRLIGTDKAVNTSEFALALARWQELAGLTPSGSLDADTWYAMVSTWQSRRIKERIYPQPDQVVIVPASYFYDQERLGDLRKVELQAYAAYKRMIAAAAADPSLGLSVNSSGELAPEEKRLKIISAFRTREYQEQLRRQSPHSGRAGLAVNSPHFTGRVLDLYVGGDPVDTAYYNRLIQTQTPVYKWLVKNAERFGFYPYYYEPWHWEYRPQ